MRIAVLGSGTGEREHLPPAIAALASSGIEPVLINTRIEVFAHTQADRALVDLGHLDAAIGAEQAGFDALFVNTFADWRMPAQGRRRSSVCVVSSMPSSRRAPTPRGRTTGPAPYACPTSVEPRHQIFTRTSSSRYMPSPGSTPKAS